VRYAEFRRALPTRTGLQVFVWWIIVRTIVRVGMKLLYRQRCLGRSNVPRQGPAIYVSNHQSHYDPPIVGCLVGAFASLARATLFDARPWGWIIRQIGAIPLHLGRNDARALRAAIDVLKAGGRVLLFPEGTRTPDGAVHAFQPGMLILVKRSGAPVVPIALEGAHDIWPIGQAKPKLRGWIATRAGPPIPAEELLSVPHGEAMERLRRAIDANRLELRRELRDATGGRYPATGPGDRAAAPEPGLTTP
jgi:1-acyl-sn-glycerol-3-phosphate acyltransferase